MMKHEGERMRAGRGRRVFYKKKVPPFILYLSSFSSSFLFLLHSFCLLPSFSSIES